MADVPLDQSSHTALSERNLDSELTYSFCIQSTEGGTDVTIVMPGDEGIWVQPGGRINVIVVYTAVRYCYINVMHQSTETLTCFIRNAFQKPSISMAVGEDLFL